MTSLAHNHVTVFPSLLTKNVKSSNDLTVVDLNGLKIVLILFYLGMIVLNGIDDFDVMIRLCGFYYFLAFIFWYQYEWNNGIKWASLKHSYENSFLLSNSGVTTCLKVKGTTWHFETNIKWGFPFLKKKLRKRSRQHLLKAWYLFSCTLK